MEKLAQRLGLRTDPTIFFTSAGLMVLFLADSPAVDSTQPLRQYYSLGRRRRSARVRRSNVLTNMN
ncbi:hypothetical protein ACM25P_09895 [Vreelandella alkaliphila]|uniref:hypothetical protein n=1 Tax=Vreelandella alkaliphila TaxID=272774 RepID=UPI0039F54175